MPINLSKGQKVDLTKGNPSLHLIPVLISTWMQQLLCVALMANARQKKSSFSTEIWFIRAKV